MRNKRSVALAVISSFSLTLTACTGGGVTTPGRTASNITRSFVTRVATSREMKLPPPQSGAAKFVPQADAAKVQIRRGVRRPSFQQVCTDDPSTCNNPDPNAPSGSGYTISVNSQSQINETYDSNWYTDTANNTYLAANYDPQQDQIVLQMPQDATQVALPPIDPSTIPLDQWVTLYGNSVYVASSTAESWIYSSDGAHHEHIMDDPADQQITMTDLDANVTTAISYAALYGQNYLFSYNKPGFGVMEAATTCGAVAGTAAVVAVTAAAAQGVYTVVSNPAFKFIGLAGPWGVALGVATVVAVGGIAAYGAYKNISKVC